jgi:hypothetical protein
MGKSAYQSGHETGQRRAKSLSENLFSIPGSPWSKGHADGSKERRKNEKRRKK